jgi:hypothetical protein
MFDWLKNTFTNRNRYRTHSEAVIVSCFFNPQCSPYRLLAFQKWYHSIKHLPHRIIECLVGPDAKQQLPDSPNITRVHADTLLFHKEALLNKVVAELPSQYKYIFWVDADVLFTNKWWLPQGVEALQHAAVIQPFEWCVHLDKHKLVPSFNVDQVKVYSNDVEHRNKKVWRSFAANFDTNMVLSLNENYDLHGHVGFAWGARREVLEQCPLYEKALIGGADHILAHAVAGQIPHPCIQKGYADNLDDTLEWSRRFYQAARLVMVQQDLRSPLSFVEGDLYHIWHGDIGDRKYLKRIQDFTSAVPGMEKDKAGFYKATGSRAAYVKKYYRKREVHQIMYDDDFDSFYMEPEFIEDMGYALADIVSNFSQPSYMRDDPTGLPGIFWEQQPDVPDSTPGVADAIVPVADGWPAQAVVPDSTPSGPDAPGTDWTPPAATEQVSPSDWPAQPDIPNSDPVQDDVGASIPDSTPSLENASPYVPDSTPPQSFAEIPVSDNWSPPADVPDSTPDSSNFS